MTHATRITDSASEQFAAVSRLFSSSVIRELARKGRSPLFARLASQSHLLRSVSSSERVYHLFETAFSFLKRKGYRDEYIYKAALTKRILLGKYSLQTASMLNEFRVGECKADIAVLIGTATVYEVKSERDSLSRLARQITAYSTVFARVFVIASEDHVNAVIGLVPDDVGILRLNNRHQISTVRDALDRPERTSPAAIFDSIRAEEARLILQLYGITAPNVPNTARSIVLRDLFVKLDAHQAHIGMVQVLKETRSLLPLSGLVNQLPPSLQTAALSVPLRKADHSRLVTAVNTHLEDAMCWT